MSVPDNNDCRGAGACMSRCILMQKQSDSIAAFSIKKSNHQGVQGWLYGMINVLITFILLIIQNIQQYGNILEINIID